MRYRVVAAAGVFCLCAGSVYTIEAQEQVPVQLTLEDALSLAQRNNPAYRRALAQADVSGANVMAGLGGLLPDLRASLSFNGSARTVFTGTDDFGRSVELPDAATFKSSSSSQGLSSNVTLFDERGLPFIFNPNAGTCHDLSGRGIPCPGVYGVSQPTIDYYESLEAAS